MTQAETAFDPTAPKPGGRARRHPDPGEGGLELEAPAAVRWLPLIFASIAVLGAYASEFSWFWETWSTDPNYSHGYFVVPTALWILWRRLRQTEAERYARESWPWQPAWLALIGLLAARWFFHHRGYRWSDSATLPPVVACLVLTLGGWGLLRRVWPAVFFLFFLMPLPSRVNDVLAQPLQSIATLASVALMKSSGLWVLNEGNVIYLDKDPIFVAEACNGLSMLMTLAATLAAAMFLFSISIWMRVILVLSIVPIALVSNILRIFATAWCFHRFGVESGGKYAHDAAGWLMMPLALAIALVEVKLLSWLILEEDGEVPPMLLGRPIAPMVASRNRRPSPQAESARADSSPADDPEAEVEATRPPQPVREEPDGS